MIERIIRSAIEVGADDFYVVTGFQAEKVESFLQNLGKKLEIPVACIFNPEWEKGNRVSAAVVREYLNENFLLLTADRLFDPSNARQLLETWLGGGETALCAVQNLRESLADTEDASCVKASGDGIVPIGKNRKNFIADNGIFLCSPEIFQTLEINNKKEDASQPATGQSSVADDPLKRASGEDSLEADSDEFKWVKHTEQKVLSALKGKASDGPVSKFINRPLSAKISGFLANFSVTPNQISVFSFLLSFLAAWFFAVGDYMWLLFGGILAQVSSIVDGCDGEIARLKFQGSEYGGWLDAVLDRFADAFLIMGLTWHLQMNNPDEWTMLLGYFALTGSFMVSYTADKYNSLMAKRIGKNFLCPVPMTRDVRILIIFLGSMFNVAALSLLAIAFLGNLEAVRRILICREASAV